MGGKEPGRGRSCELDAGKRLPFCGDKKYVSDQESAVLAVMRKIQQESLSVRARLKQPDRQAGDRQALQARLEALRHQFKQKKAELAKATEEKLRRLGHVP